MIGPIVNPVWKEWAATALAEGRLSWRVTDAQGRACNGGDADPIPLGEWSPTIEDAALCGSGWHTTSDPIRWKGGRVWLVEGDGLVGTDGETFCWRRIRPLAEVDPHQSICQRIAAAAMRPYLTGAALSGADLSVADLTGADLRWANLTEADLTGADLTRADLRGAYLIWADLTGAELTGADLTKAYLGGWERGPDGVARRVTP